MNRDASFLTTSSASKDRYCDLNFRFFERTASALLDCSEILETRQLILNSSRNLPISMSHTALNLEIWIKFFYTRHNS